MCTKTAFRIWRDTMGYTQAEAARKLDKSVDLVKMYDAGQDRQSPPRPRLPDENARVRMALLFQNKEIEPWPLSSNGPFPEKKENGD